MTIDIETLRGMKLFEGFETPQLDLSSAFEESYTRGQVIVRAHDPARYTYLVREGGIKEVQVTPEGKEVILSLHGPGDLFGELAPFHNGEAPATAVAVTASRVMCIPREDWMRIVNGSPALQRSLQENMARRLQEAWRLVRMLSRYTTEARLKSALLLLAERWGQPHEDGIEIAIDLTHRTLADLAGASREKVTRALGILQQKGLVRVVKRRMVLPSLDRLLAE
jgi:CRP/FNR family transcriptional regulator, cyclic AMP receptor protein